MSDTAPEDVHRFIAGMRDHFAEQTTPPRSDGNPLVWVNAGISASGEAVLIYRQEAAGPLIGRKWDLAKIGPLFGTSDPVDLAEQMWVNEVEDPDVGGQHLDVDWAQGLVDTPDEVLWRGESVGSKR